MEKPDKVKQIESLEKTEETNCPRLDDGCFLDGEVHLVKKQYERIGEQSVMDEGIMLK